ncbi:hypothetical protein CAEBREN_12792 [Caenorhabditis brenneri]|uniref:Ig-like domain-containing protein n=1 Tax=Caenorhabditis brenneri TaxID=135651 RepID=G0MX25_CAEBE|nr:hypothetical protein CAEBREN_12792 [Caenorhabditis brenneri]
MMFFASSFILLVLFSGTTSNKHTRVGERILTRHPQLIFQSTPDDVVLPSGHALRLECSAYSAPTGSIQWTFEGVVISGSDKTNRTENEFNKEALVSESMSVLSELHIDCPQSGRYTCSATNSFDTITAQATVRIEGHHRHCHPTKGPKISQYSDMRLELNGNTASVWCDSSNQDVSWSWSTRSDGEITTDDHYLVKDNELIIKNVSWNDTKSYFCQASNSYGSVTRETSLNVISLNKNIIV